MGTGNTRLSNECEFATMYDTWSTYTQVVPCQRCPIAHSPGAATVPPTEPPLCQLPGQHNAEQFDPETETLTGGIGKQRKRVPQFITHCFPWLPSPTTFSRIAPNSPHGPYYPTLSNHPMAKNVITVQHVCNAHVNQPLTICRHH